MPKVYVFLICFLLGQGLRVHASVPERELVDGAIVLKGSALREYHELYKDPYVLGVRNYLNRFLKGELKSDAVVFKGIQSDHSDGLANFDKDYYKSKFIVVTVQPFLGGGQNVSIVFQNKPDKMFDVWMFPLSGGEIEMRAFTADKGFSEDEIKTLYKNFITDPVHNM